MQIDSHHHLWKYDPVEYDWIDESMKTIRRSFLPEDLKLELDAAGVDGAVSVQARQSLEETDWLLALAGEHDVLKGVVGWLPLAEPDCSDLLDRYAGSDALKGLRHVVQGEAAGFLDRPDFNQGVARLAGRNLVYDILIFENQLEEATRFVDRHPNQAFVLDHIAKPRIKVNELQPWAAQLSELAKRENVSCKLSGMVTEAYFTNWTETQLQPYFDTVLSAFGPDRLLFGSDWPVCLVACGYERWAGIVREQINHYSADEQAAIMGGNAVRIYNLNN